MRVVSTPPSPVPSASQAPATLATTSPATAASTAATPTAGHKRGWLLLLPLLLTLTSLLYVVPISQVPFYTKGEPREAIVVQAIIENGDWILPLRNGHEIPSKPPLFHWLGALVSLAAGFVSEWTTRLPSAAASIACAAAVAAAAARFFGPLAAFLSTLVLLTTVQWTISATTARVDMVLAATTTGALLFFMRDYLGERRPLSLGFYACATLAVLAKGPVGLVIPVAVIACFLLLRGDREYLRRLRPGKGLAILSLAAAWYLAASWEGGMPFFDKLVLKENLQRFVSAQASGAGHVHSPLYYLPALLGGFAPWSLFAPGLVVGLVARARRGEHDQATTLLLCWFAVTLLIYSLAGSKRGVYLLSLYPALAMLYGAWWASMATTGEGESDARPSRMLSWLVSLVAAVLALPLIVVVAQTLGVDVTAWLDPLLSRSDAANLPVIRDTIVANPVACVAWSGTVLLSASGAVAALARRKPVASALLLASAVAVSQLMLPLVFQRQLGREQGLRDFMSRVNVQLPEKDAPMFFYRGVDYGAVFYAGRNVYRVDEHLPLFDEQDTWLLVNENSLPPAGDYHLQEVLRYTYGDNPGKEALLLARARRGDKGKRK